MTPDSGEEGVASIRGTASPPPLEFSRCSLEIRFRRDDWGRNRVLDGHSRVCNHSGVRDGGLCRTCSSFPGATRKAAGVHRRRSSDESGGRTNAAAASGRSCPGSSTVRRRFAVKRAEVHRRSSEVTWTRRRASGRGPHRRRCRRRSGRRGPAAPSSRAGVRGRRRSRRCRR